MPDARGLHARYLELLGVRGGAADLDTLRAIVRAHLARVPFENVSKLLRARRGEGPGTPDLSTYLDGIERAHLGGTCYAVAGHLNGLLRHLGFDAALCGADMSQPDVHAVNVVRLDGRDWLVDAGYAAPLCEPLALDLEAEQEVALGEDRYLLHPRDAEGRWRLDQFRAGRLLHGYVLHPAPRTIEHFAAAIADSFRPDATFMRALLVTRYEPGHGRVLRNHTLIESRGRASSAIELPDRDAVAAAAERVFGIPAAMVREALDAIGTPRDVWG